LNFDDTLYEPKVMPTRSYVNKWSNRYCCWYGNQYAPHNLTEVIDGTLAYMDNNDIEIDELINYIKAPDFPTEVLFMVMKVVSAFKTGRGRVVMRAKVGFEEVEGRECIIVSEIPYQVNKADMIVPLI
jgi:DNA gyrase subunit A